MTRKLRMWIARSPGQARILRVLLASLFLLAWQPCSVGAEYFVSKQGDDANDGLTRGSAFSTIQRGVEALAPGDVLTIGPGEYFESVRREGLGSPEVQTVIRAEVPGTAIVRGDVQVSGFEKVDGGRFLYALPFELPPHAVLEHDTLRILHALPDPAGVETAPGSFHYNQDSKKLSFAPSDLQSALGRLYSVTKLQGSGLFLDKPVRVLVDGLVFTGFAGQPTGVGQVRPRSWGIALIEPTDCGIRNVTAFLNYGGIGLENGSGNVVDGCLAFANHSHNILVFGGPENRDNVIENSLAYRSASGMHFYGRIHGPLTLRNNIAWGHDLDFSNKSGSDTAKEFGRVEACVGLSDFQAQGLERSIMGGVNEYDRRLEAPEGNILFQREVDLDPGVEFVDPWNLDFRLQAGSRFLGKDGKPDRGPHPFERNVFFVGPGGSDENDGLSVRSAWKSLPAALKKLRPGDTLYLLGGVYDGDVALTLTGEKDKPVRIRARGKEQAILRGTLQLGSSGWIEFERLVFDGKVESDGGSGLSFENCVFSGEPGELKVAGVDGLRIEHCLFAGGRVLLDAGRRVWMRGNLFAPAVGPAILVSGQVEFLYSDYNAYAEHVALRETGGRALGLSEVQAAGQEIHSRQLPVAWTKGGEMPALADPGAVRGWGPFSRSYGPHQPREQAGLALAGPFVHRSDATSADIEWWTSAPVAIEVSWSAPGMDPQTVVLPSAFQFGGYSPTGLQPNTEYTVHLRPLVNEVPEVEPVRFRTTQKEVPPVTIFVSVEGSDSADGRSAASAFRTPAKAASVAGPGDTIVVGGGEYPETVWVRSTGTADRPVTFRSASGEKVSIRTFRMVGKEHVRLDGFYISEQIEVVGCSDLAVTRCFARGPLLQARNSRDVLVKNCVSTSGYPFHGVQVINSPGFRLEHSVVVHPAICGAVLLNQSDQPITLQRNIFTDSYPFKAPIPYFEVARAESLELEDNCFYLRAPDEQMNLPARDVFLFYDDAAYDPTARLYGLAPSASQASKIRELARMCLEDFDAQFGDTRSLRADPGFRGADGLEIPDGGRYTKEFNKGNQANIGYRILSSDLMAANADFNDFFPTNPEVVDKGIGLVAEDFADFHFNRTE